MYKSAIINVILYSCLMLTTNSQAQIEPVPIVDEKMNNLVIAITRLETIDAILRLHYEIRNEAQHCCWILAGFGTSGADAELFMADDGQTIVIRRRLDVPFLGGGNPAYGRYVRMRPGEIQRESISLRVPMRPERQFAPGRENHGLELATRIRIEFGFYFGELPWMIRGMLEEIDKISDISSNKQLRMIKRFFRGLVEYDKLNEGLIERDGEVLIPYTYQALGGERILRTDIAGLVVPYEEKEESANPHLPDLTSCTRIEVQFEPSSLEYFFPYAGQQNLMSDEEKQDLRTLRAIILTDRDRLKAFVDDVNEGAYSSGIVRERNMAHVVCFNNSKEVNSFTIFDDAAIVSDEKYRFIYYNGLPSLRNLTPQIRPLELRMECAANLRNLLHRLRLYYKAVGLIQMLYPAPAQWCDAMVRAYMKTGLYNETFADAYICPSAGEGKCHYAMNPNCKPDSPLDMVLLFETKAGWNQHGGPELFTFDNHDPRGGCVLFNDGTVKFIRTTEELQQLRWK